MGNADDHGRGRDTDGRGRVAVERVFERVATTTVAYGPGFARFGLGAVVLLAGLHKLLAPAEWTVYLAPLFATRWPVGLEVTYVAFGVTELPVGLALLVGVTSRALADHQQ